MKNWGPRLFWSLDIWFSHLGFTKIVADEWRSLGNGDLVDKLSKITTPVIKWNREVFGNVDHRINNLE